MFEEYWCRMLVKIQGLFSDYDGTLSPLEVTRADAVVSRRLKGLLTKVGERVPIGIVTTKDMDFVRERVPFAHGIAAVSGLEMQVGNRSYVDKRVQGHNKKLEETYREVLPRILQLHDAIVVERKTTEKGELIGFCVDWRMSQDWVGVGQKVRPILRECRRAGLFVAESESSPFANIYVTEVDKGKAFLKLRSELSVTGPVIYLGDSEADNPAFKVAEISIGINHHRRIPELQSQYILEFIELEGFMIKLLDADLEFNEEMVELNPNYSPAH